MDLIESRPIFKSDIELPYLNNFQKDILLSRLNNDNVNNFSNDPNNVMANNINIDKVYELALGLPDIDILNEFVKNVLKPDTHICIISDFDTDGISSCVVIEESFKILGYTNISSIVNKRVYGTGVTSYCLEELEKIHKSKPVEFIILSDHGSSNGPEYNKIRNEMIPNVPIVLTDHHEVNYDLMRIDNKHTFAFINPQRIDKFEDYGLLETISGCGIAYLTMLLIAGKENYKKLEKLIYLVGLSTISDIMPLDNPYNRYFVKTGINQLYREWPYLVNKILGTFKVSVKDLSFSVIPTINTGNRANREDLAYNYLKKDNKGIEELENINTDRKLESKKIFKEMMEFEDEINMSHCVIGILDSNYSVAGTIAGKLGDQFHKPALIFNRSFDNVLTGSARGIIKGIDLPLVFNKINEKDNSILIRYGGHKMAGGCSINRDKLEEFKTYFNQFIKEQLEQLDTSRHIYIDRYVDIEDINLGLYKSTEIVGPYGKNWEDVVYITKTHISSVISMGSMAKVLFKPKSNKKLEGICHMSKNELNNYIGIPVYVVFTLDVSTWNRVNTLNLRIQHIFKDLDENIIKSLRRY